MARKKDRIVLIAVLCLASARFLASGLIHSSVSRPEGEDLGLKQISFIKSRVDSISEEELRAHVLALQNAGTRNAPSRGNLRAANYIREALSSYGLKNVVFDEFSYYSEETGTYETTRNVVASKPGTRTPDKIVIIGAHFDSISRTAEDGRISLLDKENPAPGADDNATGVATILAAARALSSQEFACTLRFIAFSAEEEGILGSAHYAAESARKGEDIIAVINVDMLGYVHQEPGDIDIFANKKSAWLLDRITNHAPVYAPELSVYRIIKDSYDGSDQSPFWNNGYPGVCFMEDYYPSNRLYHSPKDTLETINFPFFLNNARLAVASFAELAGIHVPDESAAPLTMIGKGIDWERDSGKRFLITISGLSNQANVIDISLPRISSQNSLSLGDLPPETWGQPRDYPVAASLKPSSRLVYITMIKMRAPGKDTEKGTINIVDPAKSQVIGSFQVNRFPTTGCFNAEGTRFYQPYWGERYIDVFDTRSLTPIDQIPVPMPLSKLVVDKEGRRAIGISSETSATVFINLIDRTVEKVIHDISVPKDVVLVHDGLALVCSYDRAKIYQIDMATKTVSGVMDTSPRPVRLIVSPQGTSILALHLLSAKADLFSLIQTRDKITLERNKVLDTGEVFADAAFADSQTCYFISSSTSRLLGYDLSKNKVFWGMRTGGVRARADAGMILYVGER